MKYLTYLALTGLISQSEALHLKAKDATCEASLSACNKEVESLRYFRYFCRAQHQVSPAYNSWWWSKKSKHGGPPALAEVESESSPTDCSAQLTACLHKKNDMLNNYKEAGAADLKGWKNAVDYYMGADANFNGIVKGNTAIYEKNHPIVKDDGNLDREYYGDDEQKEEEKKEEEKKDDSNNNDGGDNNNNDGGDSNNNDGGDNNNTDGGDSNNNDSNNGDNTDKQQQPIDNTCTGSIKRGLHESSGNIVHSSGKFQDQSFPSNANSISFNGGENPAWKDITEVVSGGSLYGSQGVTEHAVNQGTLGDCWYLSALAALSEFEDRVKDIFYNINELPADGQMKIKLWDSGKIVRIVFDQNIPVNSWNGALYTRQSKHKAVWSMLLEKGGAKFYNTYKRMEGGWMTESLWTLTGMPCTERKNSETSMDDIWNYIKEGEQKKYLMATAVMPGGDKKGLVTGHAYTLIGCKEWNGLRMLRIRNPWGSEKYIGNWSDGDTTRWTPEAKEALGYVNDNDGIFWVQLEDFMTLFYNVQISHYNKNWIVSQKDVEVSRGTSFTNAKFQFHVDNAQEEALIGLSGTQDRRFKDDSCGAKERIDSIAFSIYTCNDHKLQQDVHNHQYKWLQGQSGNQWLVYKNLQPGCYYLKGRGGSANPANVGDMPLTFMAYASTSKIRLE